jgi:membrane protein
VLAHSFAVHVSGNRQPDGRDANLTSASAVMQRHPVDKVIQMFGRIWALVRESVYAFIDDEALTRGAAIAFYTATSIGPVLFIVVAIAGLVFGEDAARGAIAAQLADLMGRSSADMLQTAIQNAANKSTGLLAAAIGVITLLITASGVFTEMQTSLNVIWRAELRGTPLSRIVRARAASLGLVAALGFLLLVSLTISTLLSALSSYINAYLPFGHLVLQIITFAVSFSLIALLFGAVYKVLPDRKIEWHDVMVGAVVTALLFTIGKSLISLYIGSSTVASSYGAAGSLIVVLLWIYYSAQIFLLGAEFTKVYASHHGSHQNGKHDLLHTGS